MSKRVTNDDAIDMYSKMAAEHPDIFGNSHCGYNMCYGDSLVVHDNNTNKTYVVPEKEKAKTIIDRIQRSIDAGRNLFYEEWPSEEFRRDVLY